MKFEVSDKTTKDAIGRILDGVFDAATSIADTCDNRFVRNTIKGAIGSIDDACKAELKVKRQLTKAEQPAMVDDIESKNEQSNKEQQSSGSIENLEEKPKTERSEVRTPEVSPIND